MGDGTIVPQATLEPNGVLHVQLDDMIEVGVLTLFKKYNVVRKLPLN